MAQKEPSLLGKSKPRHQDGEPTIESKPPTKKQQIIALYSSGVTEVTELASITGCKTSYVASVLQQAGRLHGYFDLYTHSSQPMNIYSRYFQGKLGFKNVDVARESVALLDRFYTAFENARDRAGQHHALMVALTMFDRARWSGKQNEARVFQDWLLQRLQGDGPLSDKH